MTYTLFLDESGDHGLSNIDIDFPVFVLCGILTSETDYSTVQNKMNEVKQSIWGNKVVIFHSRDIRKCEKEFQVLFDQEIKKQFYEDINSIISSSQYTIIASAIQKEKYIKQYGKLADDVYEIALSFIVERSIFYLDEQREQHIQLSIVLEKRGKKEDKKLEEHFQKLLARGTGYVSCERLKNYSCSIRFVDKKENNNGLQLADLIAYPIARYVIESERANPAFDILETKLYTKKGKRYGLKVFP